MSNHMSNQAHNLIALSLNGKIYIGDQIDQAQLSITERGFLLGDGLFETLPILNHEPLWLGAHLDRLCNSAKALDLPCSKQELTSLIEALVQQSKTDRAILRLTLSRGSGGRGLLPSSETQPTILATLAPYPETMAFQPVTLHTSAIRRNEGSPLSNMKCLGYLDNILATQQAQRAGAEDALLLNNQGHIACTTIANIFACFDDTILTPPIKDGVLPGIMRNHIIALANQIGLEVKQTSLDLATLKKADGLFLTNSLRFIRRVTKLDEHTFTSLDATGTSDLISQLENALKAELTT